MTHKGNWFEEDVLEATTGVRYYSDPKDRASQLLTKQRTIEHSDQLLPKDYKSVMSTCITNQLNHPNYKTLQDKVGPRQRQLDQRLKDQVDAEFKQRQLDDFTANRKVAYVSDAMANFNKESFQPSLVVGDPTLRVPTFNADYSTDTPITYFSDCVRRGVTNFPSSFVTTGNPFRKSTAFSADIRLEPTIRRAESNERPTPLPTIREFGLLKELRRRLFEHIKAKDVGTDGAGVPSPGRIVRILVDSLWALVATDTENASALHIDALISGLAASLGFSVAPEERRALLSAYDLSSTHMISLPDLTDFLRGNLSPRAAELVDIVLATLAAAQPVFTEGFVTEAAIVATYQKPPGGCDIGTLLSSLRVNYDGQVSADEVFEYYTDVYAELDSSQQFETLIRQSWGI